MAASAHKGEGSSMRAGQHRAPGPDTGVEDSGDATGKGRPLTAATALAARTGPRRLLCAVLFAWWTVTTIERDAV
jgi:hypothetical protein